MARPISDIAFTPAVKAAQEARGSRAGLRQDGAARRLEQYRDAGARGVYRGTRVPLPRHG